MKVLLRFTALIPPILQQFPWFLINTALKCACDASILADSHHCIFHVSTTLVLSYCCRMPIPHHFSQLYYIHWSPPSHFRILIAISIFFYLLMIMSVCSLVLCSYLKKRVWASMLRFKFAKFKLVDLANCLCLSNTDLFKFMRLDWRGSLHLESFPHFLVDEPLSSWQ